jgi:hypothetical protein
MQYMQCNPPDSVRFGGQCLIDMRGHCDVRTSIICSKRVSFRSFVCHVSPGPFLLEYTHTKKSDNAKREFTIFRAKDSLPLGKLFVVLCNLCKYLNVNVNMSLAGSLARWMACLFVEKSLQKYKNKKPKTNKQRSN